MIDFKGWLENEEKQQNEVATSTAAVASFKRMAIPQVGRTWPQMITFGDDPFFKKKKLKEAHKCDCKKCDCKKCECDKIERAAKKAGIDLKKYDHKQVIMGFAEEKEHDGKMSDAEILKITIDHLKEDPKYYTKLGKAGL
jgi:hypothetical protein